MKGIDFLRNVYATSGLAIKPKTQVSKVEDLKEIIRAWGMNPEQLLTREALAEGATTYVDQEDYENHQLAVLSNSLKQLIRQEAVGQMRLCSGGPDGTSTQTGSSLISLKTSALEFQVFKSIFTIINPRV
jgi:hypothetical protein